MSELSNSPFDVLEVANYLVGLDQDENKQPTLTNMALQKLLYFAEGEFLAETGRSLFSNVIEAWTYGPVVPDAYHAFKIAGSKPIGEFATTIKPGPNQTWRWSTPSIPLIPATNLERGLIARVWKRLGHLTGAQLMAESHRPDSPWTRVFRKDQFHVEIPRALLQAYFTEHPVAAA